MDVVGGCAWNICEFLAFFAPPCEVKGVGLKCWPIVPDVHYLCCHRVSPEHLKTIIQETFQAPTIDTKEVMAGEEEKARLGDPL